MTSQKMYVFDFPEQGDDRFLKVRNIDHLRSMFEQQKSIIGQTYNPNNLYSSKYTPQGQGIIANCKAQYCKASLRYRKNNQGIYKLQKILKTHNHIQSMANTNIAIEAFIKKHQNIVNQNNLQKLVIKQFGISKAKFYQQYKKITGSQEKQGIKQVIEDLRKLGNDVATVPEQLQDDCQLPDMVIIVSPQMKEGYKKFGQFFAFDVTYNLVRQKIQQKDQQGNDVTTKWGLGLMMGKNNHNKIIPFGIVFTNCESVDAFKFMFAKFFDMIGKAPETILSDQQITIGHALNALKREHLWDGYHLLDTFHLLSNIRLKMRNKDIFQALRKALSALTHDQYLQWVSTAKKAVNDNIQEQVVADFTRNAHRYCLCQSPVTFTGITISTSFAQSTNGLIKRIITTDKKFNVIISKVLKILNELYEKSFDFILCKQPYESTFQNPDLFLIRNSVCSKVMIAFINRYVKALSIQIKATGKNQYSYQGIHQQYTLTKKEDQASYKWYCTCNQILKTGLPCIHQMKAILLQKQDKSMIRYIHQRWIIQVGPKDNPKSHSFYKGNRGRKPKYCPDAQQMLNKHVPKKRGPNKKKKGVQLEFLEDQDLSIS